MKPCGKFAALLLSVAAIQVNAQSVLEDHHAVQNTQVLGYWIDPASGLMWAGKDNGKSPDYVNEVRVSDAPLSWLEFVVLIRERERLFNSGFGS
jgi:hypothetical protein